MVLAVRDDELAVGHVIRGCWKRAHAEVPRKLIWMSKQVTQ